MYLLAQSQRDWLQCLTCADVFHPHANRHGVWHAHAYGSVSLCDHLLPSMLFFPGRSDSKEFACNVGDPGSISGSGRSPGKGTATHSSILAWKIPWTEEPGRLQSMWLQRVRHDWATNTHTWYSSILTNTIITKVDLVTWLEVCCLYHSLSWSSVFPTAKATSFNTLAECSQTCCEHMSLATLSCGNIKNNAIYGFIVAMVIGGFDIFCIFMSYTIFICVVGNLSSADARHKDFSTCISHICAVVITYVPVFFTHHFGGHSILHHIHILIAKLYLLLPPTLNPIVYWVKTKQICEEVIKLFF